jgi:hypothetical protein
MEADAPGMDEGALDAPMEAGALCPTSFVVVQQAELPEGGAFGLDTNGIAWGNNAVWLALSSSAPGDEFGFLPLSSDGGNPPIVALASECNSNYLCTPAAVARGHGNATWFTVNYLGMEALLSPLARIEDEAGVVLLTASKFIANPSLRRIGLSVDQDGRLWWIEPSAPCPGSRPCLAWADAGTDGGVSFVSATAFQPVALASDDAGFTWYTGDNDPTTGGSVFGRATIQDASSTSNPVLLRSDAGGNPANAHAGAIAAVSYQSVWFLVADTTDGGSGWIVHAVAPDSDAATAVYFPSDSGHPNGVAVWNEPCGVLVTHESGGLTLVGPDGSMTDLPAEGGAPLPPAGAVAVGDLDAGKRVAVVSLGPPRKIVVLQLVP